MNALNAPTEVELLLFEIGGQRYGADASQVLRIERPEEEAFAVEALGTLVRGGRSLVFETGSGEGQLKVDLVHGVRPVPLNALRRLPVTARASPYLIGVWLDGEKTVLLIDLNETLKTQAQTQGRQ